MSITIKTMTTSFPYLHFFLKNTTVLQGLTDTDNNINKYKESCQYIYFFDLLGCKLIETSDISFDSNSLELNDKISMLGVTLGSGLSWNDHISTSAKAAARKLGLLFGSRRYFTPSSLLIVYKAQIRPSRIWLSSVEGGLQALSYHTGCNSEASN